MAITTTPISPTQANPYAMIAGGTSPGAGTPITNAPQLNLPGFNMGNIDPSKISTDPNQVYSLLAQAPQSMTNAIGPLLQQVFGTQSNLMKPIFEQQGAQGAAIAQSDAMKRGLTGSSIEGANMGAARSSANNAYDQYLAQQLSSLVPAYTNAMGTDITNQQSYYTNLAQAVGQQLASQIAQQQFKQQLGAAMRASKQNADAQMASGMMGGLGSLVGSMAMFSDVRLKKSLFPIFKWKGMTMFLFEYDKNNKIKDLPKGPRVGFLAHEVAKYRPDCVSVHSGYLKVDYIKLFGVPDDARRLAIA